MILTVKTVLSFFRLLLPGLDSRITKSQLVSDNLDLKCSSFTRWNKWNGKVKVFRLIVPLRSPLPPPGLHRDVVKAVVADVVDTGPVAALVDGVGDVLVGVEVVNSHA